MSKRHTTHTRYHNGSGTWNTQILAGEGRGGPSEAIPEPSTAVGMLIGLTALFSLRCKKFQSLELSAQHPCGSVQKVPIIGSFFSKSSNGWNFLFCAFLMLSTVRAFAGGMTVVPNSGPLGGGNTISITSVPFDTTNVVIGGLYVAITATNGSDIDVTVPALDAPGAYDVTVQTDSQGQTTLPGAYTIHVAPWIGRMVPYQGWAELGIDGQGYCFTEINGTLYVGGDFSNNSESVYHVWAWDGSAWTNLGTNINARAASMATDGTNLYVGTYNNDDDVGTVQMWSPGDQTWTLMGTMLGGGDARAMVWLNGTLYVGGTFWQGDIGVDYLAAWDGSSWSALGDGLDDQVFALTHDGTNLYAGGRFEYSGATPISRIAKWDGASWSALGDGLDDYAYALEYADGQIYAGGEFTTAGGSSAERIAMWDGASWSPLGGGLVYPSSAKVYALHHDGEKLYCGGYFLEVGDDYLGAEHLAVWNGTSWTNEPGGSEGGSIYAITEYDGALYVGGDFYAVGQVAANGIARYGTKYFAASGVSPRYASWTGGYEVVIVGSNLCDGADITNVTLCGVSASIQSQSATQVVVVAGQAVQLGRAHVLRDLRYGPGCRCVHLRRRRDRCAGHRRRLHRQRRSAVGGQRLRLRSCYVRRRQRSLVQAGQFR